MTRPRKVFPIMPLPVMTDFPRASGSGEGLCCVPDTSISTTKFCQKTWREIIRPCRKPTKKPPHRNHLRRPLPHLTNLSLKKKSTPSQAPCTWRCLPQRTLASARPRQRPVRPGTVHPSAPVEKVTVDLSAVSCSLRPSSVKSTSPVTENHNKNGYVNFITFTRTSSRPMRTTTMTPSTPTRRTRTTTTRATCTNEHCT